MTDNVDKKLQNYWSALRGLRSTPDTATRLRFLQGHFAMTLALEKDPRLRLNLQRVLIEETEGRASRPFP